MSKGQETRDYIIATAAPIFNERGYSGTSMSDVMAATGLKKGGIYNHFGSKDELALAAFDYNWALLRQRFDEALVIAGNSATAQLLATIGVHSSFVGNAPTPGGCPLLNTAVESDDGHLQLRQRAQAAITYWHTLLKEIIARGWQQGEFKAVDGDEVATVIISTTEGGVMLSKLFMTPDHILRAAAHLRAYVQQEIVI